MQNFQQLARGINTAPLLEQLKLYPELWNANKLRTSFPDTPHREISDIWLRFNEVAEGSEYSVNNDLECINYPALALLTEAEKLIYGITIQLFPQRIGRCLITKLPPTGHIYPHRDSPVHTSYYRRYHLCLSGDTGNLFLGDDEMVEMLTGELWWVDNSALHECINHSEADRIHLIVDLRLMK